LARKTTIKVEKARISDVPQIHKLIIGCAALHVMWSDLAEIKSVAVDEELQKQGVGNQLVSACLDEARGLGISTIFCLTYKPGFFGKFGLKEVDKMTLPQKVWTECYRCHKFPNCDETAMTMQFDVV
jgi:amino-acid N-acetyltransferase